VITTADFKPGLTIELDGDVYVILRVDHIKPGRGAAVVKVRLRNIRSGANSEKTFRSGERVERAMIQHRNALYLYTDGENFYFQDEENFDEVTLTQEQLGDLAAWLKEGETVMLSLHEGSLVGIEIGQTVAREVVQTEPGVKGDTASGGTKPATIEGGVIVQVPFFINEGDTIKVDTRSGEYVERVS
jgi:elongation factor P